MARTCKVHNPIDICSEKSINEASNSGGILTEPSDVDRSDFALKISDGQGIKQEGTSRDDDNTTQQWQKDIEVTINTEYGLKDITLTVNKEIADEVESIFKEILENENTKNFIFKKITGKESTWGSYKKNSYIAGYRHSDVTKADGTIVNSWHCYGIAVDINAKHNPHSPAHSKSCPICGGNVEDDNIHIRTVNHPIVQVFYNHGWTWGGVWKTPDYMHFCAKKG